MGPTIWPDASIHQQYALAYVPKFTSFLSLLGSLYILVDILYLKTRNTYHRIIFGMNTVDLISLIGWFCATWPMPRGTQGVVGASGNQRTCDAQGFLSQLSIATVLYSVCLAGYFMLVIRHGWTEKRIRETKLEYYFHALCIGTGIGTAIAAQVLQLYNPSGWQCWIASYPPGCTETWQWIDSNYVPSTNQCQRGDNANLYLWFLFYLPLWAGTIIATFCLYQVYAAYHRQDQIAQKWKHKLLSTAQGATKKITKEATKGTTLLTKVAKKPLSPLVRGAPPKRGSARRKRPICTEPVYTPAQKKQLLKRQQRLLEKQHRHSPNPSNGSAEFSAQRADNQSDNSSYHSSQSFHPGSKQPSTGQTLPNAIDPPKESNPPPVIPPRSNIPILSRLQSDRTNGGKSMQQQQTNSKSKLVTSQAFLYLCSFYIAWTFPSVLRIQESTTAGGVAYFHWMLLSACCCPLQGLMNFIVYIRPKFIAIRRERQRQAAIAKQQQELAKAHHHQANGHHTNGHGGHTHKLGDRQHTLGTVAGSSSVLMTSQSDDAMVDLEASPHTGFHNNGGLASSLDSGDDEESLTLYEDLEDEAELRAMDARKGDEYDRLVHGRAVADLFDAITVANQHTSAKARPMFARSNSSGSNFASMRPPEGQILTDAEAFSLFNSSIDYDSQGRVRMGWTKTKRKDALSLHNGKTAPKSPWIMGNFRANPEAGVEMNIEDRNQRNSVASSLTERDSFATAQSARLSDSFQTARSSAALLIRTSEASSASLRKSSGHSGGTLPKRVSFAESLIMVTSIAEEDIWLEEEDSSPVPPVVSSTPQTIGSGVRRHFPSLRRSRPRRHRSAPSGRGYSASTGMAPTAEEISRLAQRTMFRKQRSSSTDMVSTQEEEISRIASHSDPEKHRSSSMDMVSPSRNRSSSMDLVSQLPQSTTPDPDSRVSTGMVSTQEERSRRRTHALRRTQTDPKASTTRRPKDLQPFKKSVMAMTWRRAPMVDDSLDMDVGSNGGLGNRGKQHSRKGKMSQTQKSWKSTKKGANFLVRGGAKGVKEAKSGIKSIRNFASTFKDALKAEAYQDWATALGESEIFVTGDLGSGKTDSNHPPEEGEDEFHDSVMYRIEDLEEEKEEIDAFSSNDAFDDEHTEIPLP